MTGPEQTNPALDGASDREVGRDLELLLLGYRPRPRRPAPPPAPAPPSRLGRAVERADAALCRATIWIGRSALIGLAHCALAEAPFHPAPARKPVDNRGRP